MSVYIHWSLTLGRVHAKWNKTGNIKSFQNLGLILLLLWEGVLKFSPSALEYVLG